MATVQQICKCKNRIVLNSMPWFCGRCGRPFTELAEPAAQPSATYREPVDKFSGLPKASSHKPGCPRYSGAGECDCDTNEPSAPTRAENSISSSRYVPTTPICSMAPGETREFILENPTSPPSARGVQAAAREIAEEFATKGNRNAEEIAVILSRHFPAPDADAETGAPAEPHKGEQS